VSLDALGQDDRSKNMLVAVMLNMFFENMLNIPKQPFLGTDPQWRFIDSYLLVDEADNIMRYEFDVLRKLLLQGREFGVGVILASQYLRHFKVGATDYREPLLTWCIHKVPNVTPSELGALGLVSDLGELSERVKSLQNHQCLYKSFDASGEVIRGLPFYELIRQR
jgi:DNA phosphorothioation-dependent restriction protein DptH